MVNVPVAKPWALRLVASKPGGKRSRKKDIQFPYGRAPEDSGKGSDDMNGNPAVVTSNVPPGGPPPYKPAESCLEKDMGQ